LISRTAAVALGVLQKLHFVRDTTVELLHDIALDKFNIDIKQYRLQHEGMHL